jgi:hypothetical protein
MEWVVRPMIVLLRLEMDVSKMVALKLGGWILKLLQANVSMINYLFLRS